MVLLSSMKHFNRWLGPFLLRNGVRLRARFLPPGADLPLVDALLGVTMGQWLTGIEAADHANDLIQEAKRQKQTASLSLDDEAALRVQVLQDYYIRRALLLSPGQNNASWHKDVAPYWQFYPRLIRWLRHEYLKARFGPHVRAARLAYPALVQSPQFSRNVPLSLEHVPQAALVQAVLCTTTATTTTATVTASRRRKVKKKDNKDNPKPWAVTKNRQALVQSMKSMAARYGGDTRVERGGALCWNEFPKDDESLLSLSKIPLADLLQLVGANVHQCGPINAWLEQRHQNQFWTREYIAALGAYLVQRQPSIVVEVGAGDGLLTALLQDYVQNHHHRSYNIHDGDDDNSNRGNPPTSRVAKLRRAGESLTRPSNTTAKATAAATTTTLKQKPIFVATDNESWSIRKKAPVKKMDFRQALEHYATKKDANVIVLCSWMPMNEDWTAVFREYDAVKEYVLIGEADDGQCGDGWETWGNPHFANHEDENAAKSVPPPFQVDGFTRQDLTFLLRYQFSRYDLAVSKEGTTVSFRRNPSR